ncbi:hypothetical protein SAMN04488025_11752 [Planifilum fulgidum]|jgi:uncharacterized protein YqgC (DUF456 family)|uniref:DUF456 domain-containing protein n=1 Tax=Planifilum fulgidum TaxID=201973 RepID=A0A1I2PKH4_9BACL|nr:DUF456 family protein [Planifilum fulgidum]MBO2496163.1 DUF456 domain-containing protein [Bacillota bacterium]MBO2532990.1 DUF456 domain-containing protein [Thermoactinomycetaceae bacterium]SFG14126.1 hypothetical protein SAMN04488025_11752 [Planifilum fulgidum]
MEVLWWILVVILFVAGFAGLLIPVLPDAPLLFVGFLVYHFLIDSDALNWPFWVAAVIVMAVAFLVDYVASGVAARTYGGSRLSVLAAVAGAIIFPFILGPVGILVGPLVAVVIVELIQRKSWQEALRVGWGTLVGFLGGLFFKGLLMFGILIWFVILAV